MSNFGLRLAGEDPDAFNSARRKIGADHQHLYASWFSFAVIEFGNDALAGTASAE
jgi:hypothetical protein